MDQSRREFVRIASLAMIGACAGCATKGAGADDTDTTSNTDPDTGTNGAQDTDVGTDTDLPAPSGWTALPLPANPKLEAVGGYVYVRLGVGRLIVARIDDTPTFIALSSVCTHAGCTVTYKTAQAEVYCACHASHFAIDGTVTGGPAKRALAEYEAQWDEANNRVLVHAV
jgi:Rieske Fe-S protein